MSSIGRPREFGKSEGIWMVGRYVPFTLGVQRWGLKRRVDIRHSRGMHIHHTSPTPTETKVVLLDLALSYINKR